MNNYCNIIIPTRNEEKFIKKCIESIVNGTKDFELMNLIIVDGCSSDATLSKVKVFQKKYENIILLNNSKKIIPAALNLGIGYLKSKFIIRLDAHAVYEHNYINKCIDRLESLPKNVVNVGGIIKTISQKNNPIGNSIANVLSNKLGVGNSAFRTHHSNSDSLIEVDTVPFGCFRYEIFEEIGMFNENEHRNEDLELNQRILKNGKTIILDPSIISYYFSRSDYLSFIKQQFHNGVIVTNRFRKKKSFHKLRHFVPLVFVLLNIIYILSGIYIDSYISKYISLIFFLTLFYLLLIFISSLISSFKNKDISLLLFMPITFIILHTSYGFGSMYGFLKLISRMLKNI